MSALADGDAGRLQGSASPSGPRLQVLGSLRIWRDGAEVDAGPPQQALLLAVLLARAGQPTTTDELTWLMWGDSPPASALNTIQRYVGALRHLLEPGLASRATGSYLHRRGDAYVYVGGDGTLDLLEFRRLVASGHAGVAEGRSAGALEDYVSALRLWNGRAGAGLSNGENAAAVFVRLDAMFLDACIGAADLAMSLGESERAIPFLREAGAMEPLHEPLHARLINALVASGQPAQALGVFEEVRARLAGDLGLEPAELLVAARREALASRHARREGDAGHDQPADDTAVAHVVGRTEQLSVLWQVVRSALDGGSGVGVVEGEPGIGKTHLLDAVCANAQRQGLLVLRGRCTEGDGSPALWPWYEVLRAVQDMSPTAREPWLPDDLTGATEPAHGMLATTALPDSGARFRLFEHFASDLRSASARRPILVVMDDLQWGDAASQQLFAHLASRMPPGMAMLGALRDRAPAPRPDLTRMLATMSRSSLCRRVRLPALSAAELVELVRSELGSDVPGAVASNLHERTAGNPYFALELAKLLMDEDGSGAVRLPSSVLDAVRDRAEHLEPGARTVLHVAAVIGSEFDVHVLARSLGLDEQTCLDHLQELEESNLVAPGTGAPRSFRFAHDIVRESVIEAAPRGLLQRAHVDVADALDAVTGSGSAGIERIAYHLWSAGPLADPVRTAEALVRAGQIAAEKCAFESAEEHLQRAVDLALATGQPKVELAARAQLIAATGMSSGYVGAALGQLERAERLARDLGQEREAADLLFSRYIAHAQGIELDEAGRLARRLLEYGHASTDPVVRSYGWTAWGIHKWDVGHVGEAQEYLARVDVIGFDDGLEGDGWQLRRDLQLLWPVWRAFTTALHGDVASARDLMDEMGVAAGDDPYAITVWATFSAVIAALAGDPTWAERAADRGIAADPTWSYSFLGSYQRLGRCWARAMSGCTPGLMAAEAAEIIASNMEYPPRSGLPTWYCLLAEMWLTAGDLGRAEHALEKVDQYIVSFGQRYAEGLLMLLRAELMRSRGDSTADVAAVAREARQLSADRGAHLFERRAERFLETIGPGRT